MKIWELLLEYDINKIRQLDSALAQRQPDRSRPQASSAQELADWLETEKKVTSGELIYWILSRYLKPLSAGQYGINRWEDIGSRLLPALEKYTKLKNKKKIPPERRDINQLKSLGELEELLDQFPDEEVASKKEQRSEEEQGYYATKKATLLYNDSQIKVVIPHTKAASCYFGKNTKWCTAARGDNMFDAYNDQGPLYIVLIKPLNQRYQFHWGETEEDFMDERDKPINPKTIADQYPVLYQIFGPIGKKNKSLAFNQNPNEQDLIDTISKDPYLIRTVNNPSEKMQLTAVTKNGDAIVNIKNPSEQVKLAAVKSFGQALKHIQNPSEQVQLQAVTNDGMAIQYIQNPSEQMKLAAVKSQGRSIRYIKNPTQEMQLIAVTKDGAAIEYIANPTEEMQLIAVSKFGPALQWIKKLNPSEQVQLAAVKNTGTAIMNIENPSEQVQLAAVKSNPRAILYIKNPTPRVVALAKQLGVE